MSRPTPRSDQRLTDTQLATLRQQIICAEIPWHPTRPRHTQTDLARWFGVSQTFVSLVKHGHRRPTPTVGEVAA